MKRYLLFAGAEYYADGGWFDFQGGFDSVAEAEAFAGTLDQDTCGSWWHVVDIETGARCASSDARAVGGNGRDWPT